MRAVRLLALLVAFAGACRSSEIVSGMSESTYVQVMVELRKLPLSPTGDTLDRGRQRDSILQSLGLSAAELESAAVRLSNQPQRAARLWRAIEMGERER